MQGECTVRSMQHVHRYARCMHGGSASDAARPVPHASEAGKPCGHWVCAISALAQEKLTSLNLTTPLLSSCLTLVGVLGLSESSAPWKTMGGGCQPVPVEAADAPACSPAACICLPCGLKVPAHTSCLLRCSYCSANVLRSHHWHIPQSAVLAKVWSREDRKA